MKFNRMFLFAWLLLFSVALSACGAPPATNWPGISTDGERIYLSSNTHVYIVQAQSGTEATTNLSGKIIPLRFPLEADGKMNFYAPAALTDNGLLVVGSAAHDGHALYAADFSTASIRWVFETEKPDKPWLGGAIILNDLIFAPAGNGTLYALDLSGNLKWQKKLSEHALWTTPVSDGQNVYLATLDHQLYCLNPDSGNILWSKDLKNGIIGPPAIVNGMLYVGTLDGNLYAIETSNGNTQWVQLLEGSIWSTPAFDEDTLYIGTVFGKAGNFYALDASSGAVKWFRNEEGSIVASPLVLEKQIIYVTEQGRVQALDKSGAPQWQDNFEKNKIYTPPVLIQDKIVIAPMGSQFLMVAYDQNGVRQWTFTPTR